MIEAQIHSRSAVLFGSRVEEFIKKNHETERRERREVSPKTIGPYRNDFSHSVRRPKFRLPFSSVALESASEMQRATLRVESQFES